MEVDSYKFSYGGKDYDLDEHGFLIDPNQWDENFAEGVAVGLVAGTLTAEHWRVINFIRDYYVQNGDCPIIYTTCKQLGLKLKDLKKLFPSGYQRGACKIAGLSYRSGSFAYYYWDNIAKVVSDEYEEKHYTVDMYGFLADANEWDKNFAQFKAKELKMSGKLTDAHWAVINYLRENFLLSGKIPNVYEVCEYFNMEYEELEKLFPDGYHRGAIKLAGLRLNI
jgi:tRNA 2-thiouridine synthesizing protein E